MKSYQQLQEDIDQRRAALAQKAKERTSDYTDDSRKEMDRNRETASSSSSSSDDDNVSAGQGSSLKDKLGDAINKDVARAARGIRRAPGKIAKRLSKEKEPAKKEPFVPKGNAGDKKRKYEDKEKRPAFVPKKNVDKTNGKLDDLIKSVRSGK